VYRYFLREFLKDQIRNMWIIIPCCKINSLSALSRTFITSVAESAIDFSPGHIFKDPILPGASIVSPGHLKSACSPTEDIC
jgi:hypothetical protein